MHPKRIKAAPALWFPPHADAARLVAFGFRLAGGRAHLWLAGAHLSKTMMPTELTQFMVAAEAHGVQTATAWERP